MFVPYSVVKAEADAVADERELPREWLNDRAFAFMAFDPNEDDQDAAEVVLDGLVLRIASPRVLLAMKIAAGRAKDTADLARLIRILGITRPEEVVEIAFGLFGDDSTTLTDSRESAYFQAEDAIRQAYSD